MGACLIGDLPLVGEWQDVELAQHSGEACPPIGAGDAEGLFESGAVEPGIGRTAGGLSYWQVFELIAGVAAKARIVAFDMVEFMPERDIDGQGALVAAQLLAGTIGILARQEAAE